MDWFLYDNGLRHERFKVILINEDVFKRYFEIVKNKVVAKTESVFKKLILWTKMK